MKNAANTLGEQWKLTNLNLAVKKKNAFEFIRTATKYYVSNFKFCKTDLSLLILYLAHSPFSISKQFLTARGEKDVFAYGETPLTTLDYITRQCDVRATDTVFELGCGRGRTCFWLNAFIGCNVVGIEYVPYFVQRANIVKERFKLDGVEFRQEDMLKADLTGATVVYLYGTCLEEEAIQELIQNFKKLPAGTKIITISFPLTNYIQEPIFEVMKHFTADFTWGSADVYLHVKRY